jgi:hypothetical protein
MTAPIVPNTKVAQEKFRDPAAEITCASMRTDELRGCDCDDDAALETLRRHWIAMRAGIAPLAAELRDLAGGRRA